MGVGGGGGWPGVRSQPKITPIVRPNDLSMIRLSQGVRLQVCVVNGYSDLGMP